MKGYYRGLLVPTLHHLTNSKNFSSCTGSKLLLLCLMYSILCSIINCFKNPSSDLLILYVASDMQCVMFI